MSGEFWAEQADKLEAALQPLLSNYLKNAPMSAIEKLAGPEFRSASDTQKLLSFFFCASV